MCVRSIDLTKHANYDTLKLAVCMPTFNICVFCVLNCQGFLMNCPIQSFKTFFRKLLLSYKYLCVG
jgi:hypothetical protein